MSAAKITKKKDSHSVIFKPTVPQKIILNTKITPYAICAMKQ